MIHQRLVLSFLYSKVWIILPILLFLDRGGYHSFLRLVVLTSNDYLYVFSCLYNLPPNCQQVFRSVTQWYTRMVNLRIHKWSDLIFISRGVFGSVSTIIVGTSISGLDLRWFYMKSSTYPLVWHLVSMLLYDKWSFSFIRSVYTSLYLLWIYLKRISLFSQTFPMYQVRKQIYYRI